mmetsp:Transcript_12074/g.48628  ORF Transcript_12074/g.48628 Transcript_12074/m.48628 type:complete len:228 (+) Transcript_12074:971-1654(+)
MGLVQAREMYNFVCGLLQLCKEPDFEVGVEDVPVSLDLRWRGVSQELAPVLDVEAIVHAGADDERLQARRQRLWVEPLVGDVDLAGPSRHDRLRLLGRCLPEDASRAQLLGRVPVLQHVIYSHRLEGEALGESVTAVPAHRGAGGAAGAGSGARGPPGRDAGHLEGGRGLRSVEAVLLVAHVYRLGHVADGGPLVDHIRGSRVLARRPRLHAVSPCHQLRGNGGRGR